MGNSLVGPAQVTDRGKEGWLWPWSGQGGQRPGQANDCLLLSLQNPKTTLSDRVLGFRRHLLPPATRSVFRLGEHIPRMGRRHRTSPAWVWWATSAAAVLRVLLHVRANVEGTCLMAFFSSVLAYAWLHLYLWLCMTSDCVSLLVDWYHYYGRRRLVD